MRTMRIHNNTASSIRKYSRNASPKTSCGLSMGNKALGVDHRSQHAKSHASEKIQQGM